MSLSFDENCKNVSSSETFHEFQVASPCGMKWISKGGRLHDSVKLEKSKESQYWRVEREENDPFWSFHVLSENGEKLYVSYYDNNDDITLELKDDSEGGKKRLFVALLYKGMSYVLRAQDDKNRYIERHEKKVRMITKDVPNEKIQWLIAERFNQEECNQVNAIQIVEIGSINIKWISHDARPNQPVIAGQTGALQSWKMTYGQNSGMITFSACPKSEYFVSSEKPLNEFVFVEKSVDAGSRTFKPVWEGFGCKLQNKLSSEWVGIRSQGDAKGLIREKRSKYATVWETIVAQVPYPGKNGINFFPQIHGKDEDDDVPELEDE